MLASHTERHEDVLGDREWRWGMGHETGGISSFEFLLIDMQYKYKYYLKKLFGNRKCYLT